MTTNRQAIHYDWVLIAGFAICALSALPYAGAMFSASTMEWYGDSLVDLPLLFITALAFVLPARGKSVPRSRCFRLLWATALGVWFVQKVLTAAAPPDWWEHIGMWILDDALLAGYYVFAALALQFPPDPAPTPDRPASNLEPIGAVIFVFFMLMYFSFIPGAIDETALRTSVQSLLLFVVLDVYILLKLIHIHRRSTSIQWRRIYLLLGVTAAAWLTLDTIETLLWANILPWIDTGTWLDLFWLVPLLPMLIAARRPSHPDQAPLPRDHAEAPEPTQGLLGGPLLVYAIALPAVHTVVTMLNLDASAAALWRGGLVLIGLKVFGTMAIYRHRQISGANRELQRRWRHAQEERQRTERLEALGRLSGEIAHDFNNLLTAIGGYAQLLLDDMAPDEPTRGFAAQIGTTSGRATALIKQLMTFSRSQAVEVTGIDLNAVLRDFADVLRRLTPSNVAIRMDTDGEPAGILADRGQIEQVIMNLAINAKDAMPDGGVLSFATADINVTSASPLPLAPGRYVTLTVSDTGTGITDADREHVFEPFFTTKGPGKGTGFGLATVYGIVRQSSGHVTVESELAAGTTFTVYAPRHDLPASSLQTTPSPRTERGHETILVVEDEDTVRQFTRAALERHGYNVLEARSGAEALGYFESPKAALDLVLTDVVMPNMDGGTLATRLAEQAPGLPVVFMSGYTQHHLNEYLAEGERAALLAKPFSPETLVGRVRDRLDTR